MHDHRTSSCRNRSPARSSTTCQTPPRLTRTTVSRSARTPGRRCRLGERVRRSRGGPRQRRGVASGHRADVPGQQLAEPSLSGCGSGGSLFSPFAFRSACSARSSSASSAVRSRYVPFSTTPAIFRVLRMSSSGLASRRTRSASWPVSVWDPRGGVEPDRRISGAAGARNRAVAAASRTGTGGWPRGSAHVRWIHAPAGDPLTQERCT